MLNIGEGLIQLHTRDTSYILYTGRQGLPECLHYGGRIGVDDAAPLLPKVEAGYGGDVVCRDGQAALSSLRLDLSPVNRGDYRAPALLAELPGGATTADYRFQTSRQLKEAPAAGMPHGREPDEVLALDFAEPGGLQVELFYSVFCEANVITRRMRVTNRCAGPVRLLRCLSYQLDLPGRDYELYNLTGAWARETQLTRRPLAPGILRFGNGTGASGNRVNPFFFLARRGAGETTGEVYGFNLVYSGSHEGSVEVDGFCRTRVSQGLWSEGFSWPLAPGQSFTTPEAVLTFSDKGFDGMSQNMHHFVKNHIIPPRWRNAPRPVLVNNWEGTYFNFNEGKLLAMARVAAKLGAELFVLDDGWFGERNSDKAGLGDYDVNRKKLPGGLSGLAGRVNALGMDFGLWVEPEMVNRDSKLYRAHPDWAVVSPGVTPATGRHQLVLDICRPEVREYIINSVNATLDSANISYVKWDMNRHISDNYSPALEDQGQFHHSYILGLYELLRGICEARPDILFEGCASGGNRYDLGMLYYMPQFWISDDSDAHERQRIQTGASYGYPPCTMGCHVSAVPNHQTLRVTALETRFHTAMFGLLGYELDMTALTRSQRADVKAQIAYYKAHRKLLQFGEFHRLKSPFEEAGCRWMVCSPDGDEALVGDFLGLMVPNADEPPMRLAHLDPEALYEIAVRPMKIDIETFGGLINYILPVHLNPDGLLVRTAGKFYRMDTEAERYTASGSLLCRAGLARMQNFSGAGYSDSLRFLHDFASRAYYLRRLDDPYTAT